MAIRVAKLTRRHANASQSHGLDTQNLVMDTYIASRDGWEQVPGCEYSDVGPATLQRPGLQRALDDAKEGHYDLLLVYRLDRLAHSPHDLLAIVEKLEQAGVRLHSATEPFDIATPNGRLTAQISSAITAYEHALNLRKR